MKYRTLLALLILISTHMALNAQTANTDATKTVGPSGADYTTLKSAFDAINAGTLTGVITLQIIGSTTETSSAVLNASSSGSANYTSVNIYPTTTGLSISGNLGGVPIINLNGADNVTIDGRVNATGFTRDLTIIHSSTDGNSSTIMFTNDATYNIVKYCFIKGSTIGERGILYFSPTATTTGNSHNTVDHNEITNYGGNRPLMAIFSRGTVSSAPNHSNTISNNNIHDVIKSSGNTYVINLSDGSGGGNSYNDAWSITGNSFYDAEAYTYGSNDTRIIYIYANNGNSFNISNNYFGGNAPLCGGTWNKSTGNMTFNLMEIRVDFTTASEIQGNTIKNINFMNTGANRWWGINLQRGKVNVGTTAGNCYGASEGTGSITFTANGSGSEFYAFHFQSSNVNAQNNIIGSIIVANSSATNGTNFYGIYYRSDGYPCSLSNNTIGSITTSNSINATSASTTDAQKVWGIVSDGNSGTLSVSNNTIVNLSNGTTNSTSSVEGNIYGIYIFRNTCTLSGNVIHDLTIGNANNASGPISGSPPTSSLSAAGIAFVSNANAEQTISGNTIYNISNSYSSFTGHVAGIYYYGQSTASTVSGNLIYGLSVSSSSSSSTIHGIKIAYGVATYSNNIITLGGNTTNNLYGIYEAGAASTTSNLYFNTVYLSGSPTSGSLNSACLYNAANSSTRNFRNNSFFNARSNNGASGKHYAMYILNTGGTLTCDYNDYFASGTGGTLGYYGGDKTSVPIVTGATGNDAHSLNLNPLFTNAGGTNAADYIPSELLPAATGTGVTTDYGGSTRSVTSPEMGAWEKKNELTWTGGTSTDWSVAGNWDLGSVPLASSIVSIPSAPSNQPHITSLVSSPATCNNLTIASGAVLTIDPGKALTVNGTLTNSAGNNGLVISSDATGTGSLIQRTSLVGATVNRYITGSTSLEANMYHFVSIPVYYASPTSNLFLNSYLYKLDAAQVDPANSNYYGLWVNLGTSTSTPLSCNSGYMIYYPAASTTYTFTGNLNTGSFSPTVSYGGTYTFNLVPNPYPSAINWGASGGWVKSNIGATAWIWNPSGGNYTTLSGPSYVPAGQAFIVMASGSPVLTMNNDACVHNTQSFYKSTQANTLKISAQSNNYYDETFVGFNSSAGPEFDPQLDGFKLWGLEEAPQLWTEKGEFHLSVNEQPPPTGSLIVPLDFKTNYAGQVILNVSGVESFDPSLPIRLQDHLSGSMTNLRQNSSYVFAHDPSNSEKRFSLVFGFPDGINTNIASEVKAYISNGRICLDVPSMQGHLATITLYNALGQVIRSQQKNMEGTVSIDAPHAKGVYIIGVSSEGRNFVSKVISK